MKRKRKRFLKIFQVAFYLISIFLLTGVFLGSLAFLYFARDLPRPESFVDRQISQPTRIYDRTGENLLYTIHGEERREIVQLEDVSPYFTDALIALEDTNFHSHSGFDIEGIVRSVFINIRERDLAAGGSTITQQLVRSALLSPEKTFMRKVRELVLTIELERNYSKEDILEFYVNQISFGHNIYGIETAAQNYFEKNASELSLRESAILASLIRAPSALSPYGDNLNILIRRSNYALERMHSLGFISEEEKEIALEEEVEFSRFRNYLRAPHFVLGVKQTLENRYGSDLLDQGGFKVYTTLDFDLQRRAEIVAKEAAQINKNYNAHNISIVILDPHTGEILAMVGSADYFKDPYPEGCVPGKTCLFDPYTNVALSGRQPGSAFKPFVYATAFLNGYDDETTVMDERTNFGSEANPYIPRNYDGLFRGEVTLRDALAQSLNVPAVKTLRDLAGLRESIDMAERFGITTFTQDPYFYGLPLVLGGGEVRLLELTSAYGVFAAQGYRSSPHSIKKIEDSRGNVFFENRITPRRIIDSSVADMITDILSDNEARAPVFGSNSLLHFEDEKVAVKTGTTQNFRDGWTIGYTSEKVVGVWVGNNNNQPMVRGLGITVSSPAWRILIKETF